MTKYVQERPPQVQILRRKRVEERTGLRKSTIYLKVALNEFPKPVKLGPRMVGWIESEIEEWLSQQIEASRPESASDQPVKNAAQLAAAAIRKQRIKALALADECTQPDSALGHAPDAQPMESPNPLTEGNS